MKENPFFQFGVILAWTALAVLASIAFFSQPARFSSTFTRASIYTGLGLVSFYILSYWWQTAYAGSDDWKFATHQLLPTLFKVMVQTSLLCLAAGVVYLFSWQLGTKALPHLFGIDFPPPWYPNFQAVLPCAVFLGSILLACLSLVLLGSAFRAYGIISPMGMGALACLLLVTGSWAHYLCLSADKRSRLDAMRGEIKDVLAKKESPEKQAFLSEYRRLVEYRLGTREWNAMVFHRMADEPFGLAFRFPGYLIGVEQANRYLINVPDGDTLPDAVEGKRGISSLLNDRRRTFLSHIVEFSDRKPGTGSDAAGSDAEMVETRMVYNIYERDDYKDAYKNGFTQLNLLYEELDRKLAKAKENAPDPKGPAAPGQEVAYSHILVFCMGWNTDQQESIRNYNSLMGFLSQAAKEAGAGGRFRPLVIGLSWPSEWSYLKPLSYLSKAGDADETGLVWGSYIIKGVLQPLKLKHHLPLVVVGHSFGARVLTRAVASEPGWVPKAAPTEASPALPPMPAKTGEQKDIDLFVGLQGAVSANRFVETPPLISGWWEGAPYARLVGCEAGKPESSPRFIFTWAEKDKANPIAAYVTGAHHMGGKIGNEFCLQHLKTFWPVLYAEAGDTARAKAWPYNAGSRVYHPGKGWAATLADTLGKAGAGWKGKVFTMDMSSIVKDQPYGKGGGAHSDIYTPQMGRFLWNSIETFAIGG
jgi:hypothetical protein